MLLSMLRCLVVFSVSVGILSGEAALLFRASASTRSALGHLARSWAPGRAADQRSSRSSLLLPAGAALGEQRRGYHEQVLDHFNNPRNVGKLDADDANVGSALVGKASCGDVIKLQIEVNPKTGTITDAKFKTFGCGSAIASSSLATEMIIGQSTEAAATLTNKDISGLLKLPPVGGGGEDGLGF